MRWWQIGKRDADLDREMRSDLELEEEEQRENGALPVEARYAARRALGNTTLIREQAHEAWGWAPVERLWQDLRYASRRLLRSPGFTVVTTLILAIGIGATTAIFSLVNAVLLRPLPFPHSDRLVWIAQQDHSVPGIVPESLSYPDYFDWRAQNHTFEGMASYNDSGVTLQLHGESRRIDVQIVSANFFDVLNAAPALGRDFNWDDEKPGHRTVMLSYAFWQTELGAARDVAGTSVDLNGESYTVAGVMPRGFEFPVAGPPCALWMSIDHQKGALPQRGMDILSVVGRLRPGVSIQQAKADLSLIAGNLARQYPDNNKQFYTALAEPELRHLTGDTRPALRILFGAVLLVLLIVCANVAGLLLARSSRRGAEFGLRAAIGASRDAIVRQLLVESVALSISGGIAGVALAFGLLRTAVHLMPREIPRIGQASIDARVLLFDLGVSLATGILFGILPAWRVSRSAPANAMREGSRSLAGSRSRHRLHDALVIAQSAIGLVLLVGSGLLIRSFVRILNVPPGFDAQRVLSARVGITGQKDEQYVQFFQQLVERLHSEPGVQSVSAGWPLPMSDNHAGISFNIQGRPIAKGDEPSEALGLAMPGYFAAMRIPLLAGRDFTPRDNHSGPPVIVVNQAFADKYFPGRSPLGEHIQVRLGDDVMESPVRQVIGEIGNVKQLGLTAASEPEFFLPYAQAVVTTPYIVIRTAGDPMLIENPLRTIVHEMNSSAPVYQVETLDDYISKWTAAPRFQTFVLTCFAAIALVLAAVGLYGLLSYIVVQRTLEIGLRMALGAQRAHVLRMIVLRGVALAAIGVASGIAISAILTRLLAQMLFHVRPYDPLTFAATAALLLLVSVVASSLPAFRAARLDPVKILREQ